MVQLGCVSFVVMLGGVWGAMVGGYGSVLGVLPLEVIVCFDY